MSVVQGGITATFDHVYYEYSLLQNQTLNIGAITTVLPTKYTSRDGSHTQPKEEQEEKTGFGEIFNQECDKVKAASTEDINIRTNGYGQKGMPVRMVIRMHEYTY